MADSRAKPPRGNWAISQNTNATQGLYALALIDLSKITGKNVQGVQDQLNGGSTGKQKPKSLSDIAFLEFAFNVNPKSLGMEEPGATTITPLQDGGQFLERQGQIYKNIVINGTTGLRPNRSVSGAIIPFTGVANPFAQGNTDPDTGLPRGERTGFDDFIDLRNLFRFYWDLMRDPSRAPNTLMIWQNGKEGEYYVVEPINIKSDRDASSPLTVTYTIQLRTIERLEVTRFAQQKDSYTLRNSVNNAFQRISDIRRQLIASFTLAQSLIDRTATIGQAVVNDVLNPVNQVISALTGVITSGTRFFDIPKNSLSIIAGNAVDLATSIDNLSNNVYSTDGITTQLAIISNAYKNIARQSRALAAEPSLFTTQISSTISQKRKAYSNPLIGLPRTGGSPTYLGNIRAANAAAVAVINGNEDIKAISARLLGDAAQWKILVLLNRLRQPYISPAGDGINVLRPGDQILYPKSDNSTDNPITITDQKFSNMNTLDQRLGRDIMLVANQATAGIVLYDAAVAHTGDLADIAGQDNLSQAIVIKFNTEQLELPTHPFFGCLFPIGTKIRIQTLIGFNVGVRATLLSDRRISDVGSLSTTVTGNVLSVKAGAVIKGADQDLSFAFSVRR